MACLVRRSGTAAALALMAASTLVIPADAQVSREMAGFGRVDIMTVPLDGKIMLRSATYTPRGRVLISYAAPGDKDERDLKLALIDEDGRNMLPVFAGQVPVRAKDNGIRFMVFADNRRIHLGDFILECLPDLERCTRSQLVPVRYPDGLAVGDHVAHRWSEVIVSPDNRHVAWTTLFANFSALAFVGELRRTADVYTIENPRIISTLDPFAPDPRHADGVIPRPVGGGEVKQFVQGGTAISLVGAGRRDTPDSVVQDLASNALRPVTDTPGYTETTIFSPDERLGLTMTTRFSPKTDPAILGLVPRPYPGALNMGLGMFAYTYAVTGVRGAREGNVGPALIDIAESERQPEYLGLNLSTEPDWVFHSPMSWNPQGTRGIWIEGQRGTGKLRIRQVALPERKPAAVVTPRPFRVAEAYKPFRSDMAPAFAKASREQNVKVYGKAAGYITYRRQQDGRIEKAYYDFDDGDGAIYQGRETLQANPASNSTYVADLTVKGTHRGEMKLKITFGALGNPLPSKIVFEKDATGARLSSGHAQYDGVRLNVADLAP
ncbi:hypothetical protein [Novosphingobium soli]|uniref:Uncharacterized protein n=1 Tax=Novosphingobium soli TaxID=574956 RepID=A0ABV6CZG9_9SPHN